MIHRDGHLRSTDSAFLFRRMVRVVTEGPVGLEFVCVFGHDGYCVSTVGLDEERIRKYIREQEKLESRQGDLDLS